MTPGAPARPVTPVGGWPISARPRGFTVSPRALRVGILNAATAVALLVWLLPAPWGGLVPVALLAQAVWIRQGALVAAAGLVAGGVVGAALGAVLGMQDWRRAAVAFLLLVLSAMAVWPSRGASAGG